MRNLQQLLVSYARHHRDPRNIRTHFLGIPMIVLALVALLARVPLPLAGASLADVAVLLAVLYYLRLSLGLGMCMVVFMLLMLWGGTWLAALPQRFWLGGCAALFVVGWLCQFVGHAYEGSRPAFVDDLTGLAIGPLFVVVEWLGLLGLLPELRAAIEREAGPVVRVAKRGH